MFNMFGGQRQLYYGGPHVQGTVKAPSDNSMIIIAVVAFSLLCCCIISSSSSSSSLYGMQAGLIPGIGGDGEGFSGSIGPYRGPYGRPRQQVRRRINYRLNH